MNTWTANQRGLGWAKYVWLVYLVFFFAGPLLTPATPRVWALSILAVAVFLPLYFRGFTTQGRRLLWIASGIYAIGVLMMPINPGATCFLIYAIAFLGFAAPPRVAATWLVGMLAGMLLQAWILHWPAVVWIS